VKIGYARVSTSDQDPQLQIDALKAAGVDEILTEHASGKDRNRPVLKEALAKLQEGDTLVCWKLDRLGRSVVDLHRIVVEELGGRGVGVQVLTQGIDTTNGNNAAAKFYFTMLSAVAEFERDLIKERVREGMRAAKRNGTRSGQAVGRPRKLTDEDVRLLVELWDNGASVASLARKWNVDKVTIYRAYHRAKARQGAT
jgi:DNA invertase Pin-like site-specific DNA recombinase